MRIIVGFALVACVGCGPKVLPGTDGGAAGDNGYGGIPIDNDGGSLIDTDASSGVGGNPAPNCPGPDPDAGGGVGGNPATGPDAGAGVGGQGAGGFQGNAPDCPSSPPTGANGGNLSDDTVCHVQEGQSCAYWYTDAWGQQAFSGCTCYEQDSSLKRWSCSQWGGDAALNACPHVQPASYSDCFGHVGTTCPFPPRTQCGCSASSSPVWVCSDSNGFADAGLDVSPPPDTIPADKPIKDLSDTEAAAFCTWFSNVFKPPGVPAPPEQPVDADGYISNLGMVFNPEFFANACMPNNYSVAPNQCVQNLKLGSCGATVAQLSDCVLTLGNGFPQVHGCGRFFEHPECDGTIVHSLRGSGGERDAAEARCDALRIR